MDSFATFLAMGGYAAYVWPCFGLTFAVLAGLYAVSRRGLEAAEAELKALRATLDAADEA